MHSLLNLVFLSLLLSSCRQTSSLSMKELKKKGQLTVVTRNSPMSVYMDKDGILVGPEAERINALARHLEIKVKFVMASSLGEVFYHLENGNADIAAAGLTQTIERDKKFLASESYQRIYQTLICHPGFKFKTIGDLKNASLAVVKDSSYEVTAKHLVKEQTLSNFVSLEDSFSEQILEQVQNKEFDCTIVDSHIFSVFQRYYSELKSVHKFNPQEKLVWYLPRSHEFLHELLKKWMTSKTTKKFLANVKEHYYGYTQDFTPIDTKIFLGQIKSTLPQYKALFKKAGKKYKFPWKLLASISYQESHWNPKAISPTGVKGMMMLTRPTARAMGVKNRMDVEESIMGGAKYLRKVLNQMPRYIPEQERLWMAMASYNVGYYHLRDARGLAVMMEKNPNLWRDVKQVLPYLSLKKYYKRLPHGYARGKEPVAYVQRIRNYYDILKNVSEQELVTDSSSIENREIAGQKR